MPDQTDLSSDVQTWNGRGEYHKFYPELAGYSPKQQLDSEIVEQIIQNTEGIDGQVKVAELGAGPAPISSFLKKVNPDRFDCAAYDLNPEMSMGKTFSFPYTVGFDLTDPKVEENELGVYDVVVLEHSLYTATMAPDGTRNYTKEEAQLMRQLAFDKAAAMLKPNGVLVLSDPISKTEDFGAARIVTFLKKEQEADKKLGKGTPSLMNIFLRRIQDKNMKKVLAENKKLMGRVILASEEEMKSMIKNSELFEETPIYENSSDYLGSNFTTVLRRNGSEITNNPEVGNKLDSSVVIEGIPHPKILELVGTFRKEIYAKSGTTNQLPKHDKFDKKSGALFVYLSKNKPGLAAVATLQPQGDIGMDVEELMIPDTAENNISFADYLSKKIAENSIAVKQAIDAGHKIKFSEIRRLAADGLDRESTTKFFSDLAHKCNSYANKEGIDILLFLTEPKRARLFNFANGMTEFRPLEGFKLGKNPEHQTMMLCAADYFFGDWKQIMTENEAGKVNEVIKMIKEGDDWRKVAKRVEGGEEAVKKLIEQANGNVSIYFTDYPIQHK